MIRGGPEGGCVLDIHVVHVIVTYGIGKTIITLLNEMTLCFFLSHTHSLSLSLSLSLFISSLMFLVFF